MRPKTTTIATAHDSDNTSSPADSDDDASSPPSGIPLLDLVTQWARSRRQEGRRRRRALLAQARGAESASQTDPHVAAFRRRQRLERDLAEEGEGRRRARCAAGVEGARRRARGALNGMGGGEVQERVEGWRVEAERRILARDADVMMPCREEDEPVMQELELLKREEAKAEAEAEEQQLNERARILWLANRQRIHDEAPRYVDGLPVRDVLRPPRVRLRLRMRLRGRRMTGCRLAGTAACLNCEAKRLRCEMAAPGVSVQGACRRCVRNGEACLLSLVPSPWSGVDEDGEYHHHRHQYHHHHQHQYQQQQPGKHHPHQSESTMAVVVAGHAEENSQQEEYHAKVRAAMERIREARDGPARVRQRGDGGLVMARTGAWALPMRKKRDDKED